MDPADPPYSTNYDLYPGFWYTVEGVAIDLCEGDFDGDGDVDDSDLAFFADAYAGGDLQANLDNSGYVDEDDLALFAADFVLTNYMVVPLCEGDFNGDCNVDGFDLAIFASDFGRTDCSPCLWLPYLRALKTFPWRNQLPIKSE